MDSMSNPKKKLTVWVSGTQFGKTSVLRNDIGRAMDLSPGPMMLVEPTLEMAESFSKDRLSPFIRDTPRIKKLIKDNRARDSGNTLLHKKFPGGFVVMSGANSPASLAMRPVGRLYLDEIDKYEHELARHGDPLEQAISRTSEFWDAHIMMMSTPTDQYSRIWQAYLTTNMQQYWLTCPHCKSKILFKFKNLKWEIVNDNVKNIYYECPENKCKILEQSKKKMIREGEWIADHPEILDRDGFWINVLYKPYGKWIEIIEKFLRAKHDPTKLHVFINNELAEIFESRGDAPDHLHIYARREFYDIGSIPSPDILFLTAAVDTQDDRFEVDVNGWTRNHESYLIEHVDIMCDTKILENYQHLDKILERQYQHPSGTILRVKGLGIDTGGHATHTVYMWCRRQDQTKVYALKGATFDGQVGSPKAVDINFAGQKISNGIRYWPVGVSQLKADLYSKLRLKPNEDRSYPFGYRHYPDMPEDYFRQLTAESLTVSLVRGIKKYNWKKHYERNEALDLNVYNRAVVLIMGMDRIAEVEWDKLENQIKNYVRKEAVANKPQIRRRTLNKGLSLD
jgi:phage terminase large subunit GpA-like protein